MAYNASQGHLRRDGSRVRQDGGPPVWWRCVLTGPDTARGVASTGAKTNVCSSLLFLFSCSNERTIDHVATRARANQNPLYTLCMHLYISYSEYIRVV
nr:MAG TPA: hypothetical protein [Caudoviricetes sp.]